MARKLNAQELHDELLIVAGLEKNAEPAVTTGNTEEFIKKIMENVDTVKQLDAEQKILTARLIEKRLELDVRLAELTKLNEAR
jgi:hypothetical protein